jgi:DNA polymerase I-like protein with 3'-5' exonuclease and polymerase domains
VAQSRKTGKADQTVTYKELGERLNTGDRQYIETLTQAMENYQRQWDTAYQQKSLASGMDIGRMDAQLEYLAKQISDPLIRLLEFVEKMGLHLDDHYLAARMLAEDYLKANPR